MPVEEFFMHLRHMVKIKAQQAGQVDHAAKLKEMEDRMEKYELIKKYSAE